MALSPLSILAGVLRQSPESLADLNGLLQDMGLPPYWLGGARFHTGYRLGHEGTGWDATRMVVTWRPPFVRVAQVYLTWHPGQEDQMEVEMDL